MKIRILVVLPNDQSGGAEQYLKMLVSNIDNSQIDIFFLSKHYGDLWNEVPSNISLNYQNVENKFISVISFFLKILFQKNKKYDYIFSSHVYINGLIGLFIGMGLLKKKYFVARESTSIFLRFKGIKLKSYKLFYWLGYRQIDLLICQTDLMKNQLTKGLPIIDSLTNVVVIPNPIDIDLISKKIENSFIKDLPKEYLISAGRFIPIKGFANLINIFSQIKIKNPDLFLIILGNGPDHEILKKSIKNLNLEDSVILPGYVQNVYPYFKNASVCIVPSIIEGFPNVLLQMMSQNNKVVSTLCAGGIESIPNIYTCQSNNNSALREKIETALSTETNNRQIFDTYLKERNIKSFIKKINHELEVSTTEELIPINLPIAKDMEIK